ncbi:hypothetical protein D3C81_2020690 [compost metagenome]
MALAVLITKLMSGSRYLFSGVGTQRIKASHSVARLKSVVALKPVSRAATILSAGMCSI